MFDYLERLTNCTELDMVWQLHCEKMTEFGFDRLVFAHSRFASSKSTGPRQDALLLSSHDTVYFRRYMEEGHYLHAPFTAWALDNVGSLSWDHFVQNIDEMDAKLRAVFALNKAYDVTAGYSISLPRASNRTRGIMALTARKGMSQSEVNSIWRSHGPQIELLCNIAHLKIIALPHTGFHANLSPRQLEVLEWVGEGKTNQDIATIMGLSAATVEKHLRLAREKMDVETTAQAVLKASFQNQIFLVQN